LTTITKENYLSFRKTEFCDYCSSDFDAVDHVAGVLPILYMSTVIQISELLLMKCIIGNIVVVWNVISFSMKISKMTKYFNTCKLWFRCDGAYSSFSFCFGWYLHSKKWTLIRLSFKHFIRLCMFYLKIIWRNIKENSVVR
jgi:hypothetical protein